MLKGKNLPHNINNPKLGQLKDYHPERVDPKRLEGLEFFTAHSPKATTP